VARGGQARRWAREGAARRQQWQFTEVYGEHLDFLEKSVKASQPVVGNATRDDRVVGEGNALGRRLEAAHEEAAAVEMMGRRLREPYRGRPVLSPLVPNLLEANFRPPPRGISQSGSGGGSGGAWEAETAGDMSEGDWDASANWEGECCTPLSGEGNVGLPGLEIRMGNL